MSNSNDRILALSDIKASALRQEWERVHGGLAPKLSADLLRMGIAYRLQVLEHGGLSRNLVTVLKAPPESGRAMSSAKPGTRLVRSWNGTTISVEIDETGYLYKDRRYRSLSAIAREVTGTNWSGPRFFGLDGSATNG